MRTTGGPWTVSVRLLGLLGAALLSLLAIWWVALEGLSRECSISVDREEPGAVKPIHELQSRPVIRILAVRGGGVRGVIPAAFLAELERQTGKPTAELFDLFAGISTGGLLVSLLQIPDAEGKPKYSAAEVEELYQKVAAQALTASPYRRAVTLNGMLGPRLDAFAKQEAFDRVFGPVRFRDLLRPTLLAAYCLEQRMPMRVSNWEQPWARIPAASLVAAITAAPSIFQPVGVTIDSGGDPSRHLLVDVGFYQSTPAHLAIDEAWKINPDASIYLLSLGTGHHLTDFGRLEVNRWGGVVWLEHIFNLAGVASAQNVDAELQARDQSLGDIFDYAFFDVDMEGREYGGLFDANPAHIAELRKKAHAYIRENQTKFQEVGRRLVEIGDDQNAE